MTGRAADQSGPPTPTTTPGRGRATAGAGQIVGLAERVGWAVGFITVSMLGVAAIALFLSTVADSALGAAIGTLATLVASEVLVTLNSASVIQPYLPTRYWLAWIDFFRQPIFWRDIQRGFAIQAVYGAYSWPRPGPTSPRKTSPLNRLPQRAKPEA